MVNSPTHACLEPEVLAAYADHGLSLTERARVEGHLASCPRCTTLLAGVVRTVAELGAELHVAAPEATPAMSRRAVFGAAAAAAAVIAVLALPTLVRPWLEHDAELVSLAGSDGEHRSVLGRLSGGFPHAPLPALSAGGQDTQGTAGTGRVLPTSGRIRGSFGDMNTPARLHALGVSSLLSRRYDEAAQLLLAAAREQPANARYLNDVATVHLERARIGLRPDDLPRALAAAERATRLDPSLTEAWFNRALAINALSLTDQAKAAWTEYLKHDSGSPWAGEARARLEQLQPPAAAWETMAARLDQPAIDVASADAAVRTHTTGARAFIENELFVDWADAVLAGNSGSAELDRARVMAEAMLRVAGDPMYRDAVAAIDQANSAQAAGLARAYRSYAAAAALVAADRYDDALNPMTSAHQQLQSLNTPVRQLAVLGLGTIAYVRGAADEAERLFASLGSGSYAYVRGRASWMRGMMAFSQGRLADAQSLYEETLHTFERMGDVEQAAQAHNLLSGVAFQLGDRADEWRHRLAALSGLPASSRFRIPTMVAAAISARVDSPEAALAIQDGVVAAAKQSGRAAAIVDVLAQRASTLLALGRTDETAVAVAEARHYIGQVPDATFRSLLELPLLAVESDLARASNPGAAAMAAQQAITLAESRRERARLPQFQLRLAKANIARGKLDEAERALNAGIQAFDETRANPAGVGGLSSLDESWQLFETAVQLAIRRGDYDRAFAMAERGRAHIPQSARRRLQVPSLAELQRTMGQDEAILALNQFDDELALWVIRSSGTTIARRPLRRADARLIAARQQDEIRHQASPGAGGVLYDNLIRPVSAQLVGVTRLSFVPDTTFQDVSFAALWDHSKSRFLAEQMTLAVAPSVTTWHLSRVAGAPPAASAALVLSADSNPSLVTRIAEQYQSAEVVTGQDATRTKLLAGAPVMHIAAPSVRNPVYPSMSRLVLSDAPGRKYSGAVMSDEIASQPMASTRLVVLDEVRTQQSYRTAGTFDLATAFLAAGVPAVLGTLPGADEGATRELMVGFHRELAGQASAAEALSRVQRNALQQNGRRLGAWTALVIYGSDR